MSHRLGHIIMLVIILAPISVGTTSCEDEFRYCSQPSESDVSHFPDSLSSTGISSNNVLSFAPQFALWTDGASKKRWIQLPEGEKINTSDMDAWQFPLGTKLWKEFSIGGKKIETRILEKTGPDQSDWKGIAYIWNVDGTEAKKAEYGGINVNGTSHNVPSAGECFACHGGRPNRVLGFSAVQLAYENDSGLDLTDLIDRDLVTYIPESTVSVPGNESEKAALGYLHANCSHCHNNDRPNSDNKRCFDPEKSFSFLLSAMDTDVTDTDTYQTALDQVTSNRNSVLDLMSNRGDGRGMPPLGTEKVDSQGIQVLERWINAID